jgi:hypothetical protein
MDEKVIPVGVKRNEDTATKETNKKMERQSQRCKK